MLAELITSDKLSRLAGERAYGRGKAYFEAGAVVDLIDKGTAVLARVEGTDTYRVSLSAEGNLLRYNCTCPVGAEGAFCKHAVAAGLTWLAAHEGQVELTPQVTTEFVLEAIRRYLEAEDKAALVTLLMTQIDSDASLRARLRMRAAARESIDLKVIKATIRKAMTVRGFVDYYAMDNLLRRVDPIAEMLSEFLLAGHAEKVVELSGYALQRGFAAYARTDNSDGGLGDRLRDISGLHLDACRKAEIHPKALAKTLFDLQIKDDWGLIEFDEYAPLMGEQGLEHYRRFVNDAWGKVPALSPSDANRESGHPYATITHMMEMLARRDQDTDALVAIKARDLSRPYHFFEIAKLCADADRHQEALEWAERGRRAFPDELNVPLAELLVEEYHRHGHHDDAVAVCWDEFMRYPILERYRVVKRSADYIDDWQRWREQALQHLSRRLPAQPQERDQLLWMPPHASSVLVEIYLWEGDSEAALCQAKAGGCGEPLWLELAAALKVEHPEDAIEIYRARIDPIVDRKNTRAYDEAAEILGEIQRLMQRIGQAPAFSDYLAAVRPRHKAKRNFMQRIADLPG
ncbi:MAG: SWIM zinc finger family protein [Gammaproteobacteria bacterium]